MHNVLYFSTLFSIQVETVIEEHHRSIKYGDVVVNTTFCSLGPGFEFWSDNWPSWLNLFMILLIPSWQMLG